MIRLHKDWSVLPMPTEEKVVVQVSNGPAVTLLDLAGKVILAIDIKDTPDYSGLAGEAVQKYLVVLQRCQPAEYREVPEGITLVWLGDVPKAMPTYVQGLLSKAIKYGVIA